ncbi:MAG: UvrD-helicase domain-containing protein [Alphaproteobacteria bacterium]|nr:UvrD-helicase domain-containing protein [Alphaproteobacteria bacterium]
MTSLDAEKPLATAVPARRAYLDNLNPEQRQAVETVDGPLLVLAGAGTGKTRVLTTRIAHLLLSGHAVPGQILAVTFTNKASREMKERIGALIGRAVEGLWVGTFHSVCAQILRRHAELLGLKSSFTILDMDDQIRLLKQVIVAANLDEKRWPARVLSNLIQRWKDRGLTPDKVSASDASEFANGKGPGLYATYQERLKAVNAVDFGDLILHCLTLFTKHEDVLQDWQRRFRYLLVDEYQDSNVAQYLWLRLLARKNRNLCVVGDDDQSIYGWRGAEVGNILRFEKDFPGARVIRLERNYRSTHHILEAASDLIAKNAGRLGKRLWTDLAEGEKLRLCGVWDGEEEARVVGEEIETLHRASHALNEIAVLVRAGFQTREFEERLVTLGVPYRIVGSLRFYERQEIRDAIAYLRVLVHPGDDLAFERIVNTPKRGLGEATLQAVHRLARAEGLSLTDAAARLVTTDELKPRARSALAALLEHFTRWRSLLDHASHADLTAQMLDESGYTEMWQKDKSPDAPGRLENLKELVAALEEFDSLVGFLEHVSLIMENEAISGNGSDMVNLMTLHSAKGLEFDTVFLPGWEEGVFPHQRTLDEEGNEGLEEERRLAYVGLTRARKRVYLSFAANRRIYNQWQSNIPSRFLDELPPEHVEVNTETGLYGGAYGGAPGLRESKTAFHWDAADGYRPAHTLEGKGRVVEVDAAAFAAGARVFHQKFGYGLVLNAEGDRLYVSFDKAGRKKVLASFVTGA